jgi:hypothetical protein
LRFTNCKWKCSFSICYLYQWVGTICFLKIPTLGRPRLHLGVLFQIYEVAGNWKALSYITLCCAHSHWFDPNTLFQCDIITLVEARKLKEEIIVFQSYLMRDFFNWRRNENLYEMLQWSIGFRKKKFNKEIEFLFFIDPWVFI